MSTFKLEIITPNRQFLNTMAEALTVRTTEGELTMLKGHAPMTVALTIGQIKIKENGIWRNAFCSEGFINVRPDEVLLFSQTCEWPEEIDIARAEHAKERALEQLRQKQSIFEHKHSKIALARAMARLTITSLRKSD